MSPTYPASLLVVIPCLNEATSIESVVRSARAALGADVLVVDDGSRDGTADVASAAGAIVVSHPFNLGVGGAIRTGLRYALVHGYGRVVQVDGDGQHDPLEAKRLLDQLDTDGLDLVVGSRFTAGYDLPRGRRLAARCLSAVISRRVGTPLSDTTSGFRAMSGRAVTLFADDYPVDYLSDTVEALLIAHDAGLRIGEASVRMRTREQGRPSASTARSLYHLTRLFLVILLHHLRRRRREWER